MKQKKVEIQARDKRIMQFAYEFRVVTYGQIRQRFFPKQSPAASRNRIWALRNAGYFKSLSIEKDGIQMKCVAPLAKCWDEIKLLWGCEVENPLYVSESIEHDLRLVDIALKLGKLKLFDKYVTENLLQSSAFVANMNTYREAALLQPDGILTLKHTDGTPIVYSVEFEISHKLRERYYKKIESYYRAGGIDGVLYICGNKEIQNLIAKIDKEICGKGRSSLYFAIEADVLNAKDVIKFQSSDGRMIGLY